MRAGFLIGYVREVRAGVSVPVTTADDFNYWNKAESRELAAEIDFITLHAHPMWNGRQLDEALPWLSNRPSRRPGAAPRARRGDRRDGVGDIGPRRRGAGRLIKGRPGEAEQRSFFDDVRTWAETKRLTVFMFEAFDENWKGGPHVAEVEKHWGLFRADRSAKAALTPG